MPVPQDELALAALNANRTFLELVYEHASCGFALIDASGRILRHNQAFAALTGTSAPHVGQRLHALLPHLPAPVLRAYDDVLNCDANERHLAFEFEFGTGERRFLYTRAVPIHDAGQLVGLAVTLEPAARPEHDQSPLRQLQLVTSALAKALTASDVKRVVLEQALKVSGAYGGTLIKVLDEQSYFMVGSAGYDTPVELTWRSFPADAGFPVSDAIREKRPVFATIAELKDRYPALIPLLQPGTRAVAAIPLISGGRVLSGLTLSFRDETAIAPERQAFMLALVDQCAHALERARLYDTEHQARERAALLAEVSTVLSASLDVNETLARLTTLANQHVSDWCAVFEADAAGRTRLTAVAHDDPDQMQLLRDLIERFPSDPEVYGTSAWVVRTGESILLPVVPASLIDAAPTEEQRATVRKLGFHSLIVVPLTSRGRHVGALALATAHPSRTYGQEDLKLARDLAQRAAQALDNAHLHEAATHGEERYRSLVDATRQTVWITTPDGQLLGEQPGWTRLTGQTRDAYREHGWADAIHPEDRAFTIHAWKHALTTRTPYEVRHRVRVADGSYRSFYARGVPVLTPAGEIREWVGVHTDITDEVEARRALRDLNRTLEARVHERTQQLAESERRFRSIFDSQYQFIGLMQPDGILIEANRTALDFAAIRPEDVLGKPFWDAHWWQTSEETKTELQDAIRRAAAGETVRYEVDVLGQAGSTATIDFSLKPVLDEQGTVTILIPEGRVISDERRNAAVLQAVVSSAPLIVFALDQNGTYLISAGAALAKVDGKANELVGRNAFELYRDRPHVLTPMTRALAGEHVHEVRTYAGMTFEHGYRPLRDTRGKPIGMVGLAVDVTDRARAEREREEARARAEVLAALGDTLQLARTPEDAAERALKLLGPVLHASAMLVMPVDETSVHPPTTWGDLPTSIRNVMNRTAFTPANRPAVQHALSARQPLYLDNDAEHAAFALEPIIAPEGTLLGFLQVWRAPRENGWTAGERDLVRRAAATVGLAMERVDASKQLHDQSEKLLKANTALKRSNAELERFAFIASHDLQEPLRTIASFSALIHHRHGAQLDERGREYLALVSRGAERMKVLIDDLLVFSRLNSVQLPLLPLDANRPLTEATSRLHALIEQSGAQIESGDLPVVQGEEGELTQLFQNLIGNAIKFRRVGVIPVVRLEARPEDGCWHFTVSDNGIGIEPQYHERVFGLFQRLHVRERYEGTGLGLAIVQKIVERHGGRVWLESEPQVGTTVHFTLRTAETENT